MQKFELHQEHKHNVQCDAARYLTSQPVRRWSYPDVLSCSTHPLPLLLLPLLLPLLPPHSAAAAAAAAAAGSTGG